MNQTSFEFGVENNKPCNPPKSRKTSKKHSNETESVDSKEITKMRSTISTLRDYMRVAKALTDASAEKNANLIKRVCNLEFENQLLRAGDSHGIANQEIPADMLSRLIRLAHPDRHGNSEGAKIATQWLLEQRSR